jgi:hypothetical protein
MARILRGAPAWPRAIMARGGRLPRAAGRPPRFLSTGHQRAISLSDAHLQAARETPDTRSSVRPRASFNRSCSTGHRACERKGGIPRPGRGRPQRRRGARVRGGLFAAAEVADAGPGHRSQTRRPSCAMLRRYPDCPVAAAKPTPTRLPLSCLQVSAAGLAPAASMSARTASPVTCALSAEDVAQRSRGRRARGPVGCGVGDGLVRLGGVTTGRAVSGPLGGDLVPVELGEVVAAPG